MKASSCFRVRPKPLVPIADVWVGHHSGRADLFEISLLSATPALGCRKHPRFAISMDQQEAESLYAELGRALKQAESAVMDSQVTP